MAKQSDGGNVAWFLAGLTDGIAGAILFAPKSGKETRESIADAAAKGRDLASRTGREVADLGREVLDQGRSLADEAKDAVKKGKKILEDLSSKPDEDTVAAN